MKKDQMRQTLKHKESLLQKEIEIEPLPIDSKIVKETEQNVISKEPIIDENNNLNPEG